MTFADCMAFLLHWRWIATIAIWIMAPITIWSAWSAHRMTKEMAAIRDRMREREDAHARELSRMFADFVRDTKHG